MSATFALTLRQRLAPTFTLLFMAPFVAEILSGSTRFRALFVFPIEMCVRGGGALLIRHAARRFRLGWAGLLTLALALAMAEETVIQQSSLAPLVIMLKGAVYARTFGVNWLYLPWALVYESVFVVFVPVCLTELIFHDRRDRVWMGNIGVCVTMLFFALGSVLAWFAWTHVARVKVFHQPPFVPPPTAIAISLAVIAVLIALAFGPLRRAHLESRIAHATTRVPPPWLLALLALVWSALWYALVVIAFGIAPSLPPAIPFAAALLVAAAMLHFIPRWITSPHWQQRHAFWLCSGSVTGLMAASFAGFQGPPTADLGFKLATNLVALASLARLGWRSHRADATRISR